HQRRGRLGGISGPGRTAMTGGPEGSILGVRPPAPVRGPLRGGVTPPRGGATGDSGVTVTWRPYRTWRRPWPASRPVPWSPWLRTPPPRRGHADGGRPAPPGGGGYRTPPPLLSQPAKGIATKAKAYRFIGTPQ